MLKAMTRVQKERGPTVSGVAGQAEQLAQGRRSMVPTGCGSTEVADVEGELCQVDRGQGLLGPGNLVGRDPGLPPWGAPRGGSTPGRAASAGGADDNGLPRGPATTQRPENPVAKQDVPWMRIQWVVQAGRRDALPSRDLLEASSVLLWPSSAVVLLLATVLLSGCGLAVELLEARTQPPAEVHLSLRVAQRDGTPVPGLEPDDFTLFEDGESLSGFESQLAILNPEEAFQIDHFLLLDMSGSVVESGDLPALIEAASAFALSVADTGDVAVAVFDGREDPQLIVDFTRDDGVLAQTFDALSDYEVVDTSTNLYGAVRAGLDLLDSRSAGSVLFAGSLTLFTDGTHRAGTGGAYPTLAEVRRRVSQSDHAVFSIGLGGEIDEGVLTDLGKDGFAWADEIDSLDTAFDDTAEGVAAVANSYYAILYCSPARTGEHRLRLEIEHEGQVGHVEYSFDASSFEGGCTTDGGEERSDQR